MYIPIYYYVESIAATTKAQKAQTTNKQMKNFEKIAKKNKYKIKKKIKKSSSEINSIIITANGAEQHRKQGRKEEKN